MVCSARQHSPMSEVRAKELETVEGSTPKVIEEQPGGKTVMRHDRDGVADTEAVRAHKELQELSEELTKMLDLKVRKYVSNFVSLPKKGSCS